jgi:hypothetical protein
MPQNENPAARGGGNRADDVSSICSSNSADIQDLDWRPIGQLVAEIVERLRLRKDPPR